MYKRQSLDNLKSKYIKNSTIEFCTDASAYGFVIGLNNPEQGKIIIKLNLNYFSPYGKKGEYIIRSGALKRSTQDGDIKKNANIDDFKREVANQIHFSTLSTAIPKLLEGTILQRQDAISFSEAIATLEGNNRCPALKGWNKHVQDLSLIHI